LGKGGPFFFEKEAGNELRTEERGQTIDVQPSQGIGCGGKDLQKNFFEGGNQCGSHCSMNWGWTNRMSA